MNIQALIDTQIDRGTAEGQLLHWDDTTKRFLVTDESKLRWDDSLFVFVVNGTTRTKRLLAGGIE
jgi:hypothetical protein